MALDLVGQRFGRLTVTERAGTSGEHSRWLCQCDCGNTHVVDSSALRRGASKSCGCLKLDIGHGAARRGRKTPEYFIWVSMRQRCGNPRNKGYPRYGARGIRVCDRWSAFEAFLADMGPRPSPTHSVERRDNNGPYAPDNCHWATPKEQANNSRRNIEVTYLGRRMTLMQAVELAGSIPYPLAIRRVRKGWPIERALA